MKNQHAISVSAKYAALRNLETQRKAVLKEIELVTKALDLGLESGQGYDPYLYREHLRVQLQIVEATTKEVMFLPTRRKSWWDSLKMKLYDWVTRG